MSEIYNFDEEDRYVEFIFDGNKYLLWYPTTEEVMKIDESNNESKFEDFLIDHIKKPEGATYPDFKEVKGKMNVKQAQKFKQMITAELSVSV